MIFSVFLWILAFIYGCDLVVSKYLILVLIVETLFIVDH